MNGTTSDLVLGLSTSGHDAAYAIVDDLGLVVVHCEYERDIRVKEAAYDPLLYFLSDTSNDIYIDRIKVVCFPLSPSSSSLYETLFSSQKRGSRDLTKDVVDRLITHSRCTKPFDSLVLKAKLDKLLRIVEIFKCYGHHECHAAEAVYSVGLNTNKSTLIVTADGGGWDKLNNQPTEVHSGIFIQNADGFKCLKYQPKISLGGIYEMVTRQLGYSVGPPKGSQQGSVMGLAAFGDPNKFKNLFEDDSLWENTSNSNPDRLQVLATRETLSLEIKRVLSFVNDNDDFSLEGLKADLAASLQLSYETRYLNYIRESISSAGLNVDRVVLSGGCALNCAAIGKISTSLSPLEINVSIAPYDAGLAVGAAYRYVLEKHQRLNTLGMISSRSGTPFLGRPYSNLQMLSAINSAKLLTQPLDLDLLCRMLGDKKIVAIFQGRSESGRRALCNRSILADPREEFIRDIMNERVKHRPLFRPFAPVLPLENVSDYFNIKLASPFMSHAIQFKASALTAVPAVVHKDGTGRLQTVSPQDNLWMYRLLVKWGQFSGHPVLINTSFNDNEPIVEDPCSAILCYLRTNIDYLVFPEVGLICNK